MSAELNLNRVKSDLLGLQSRITQAVSALDGTPFLLDAWQKAPGDTLQGQGLT